MSRNRYIDGSLATGASGDEILDWQPSGRAGSFSIPAVQETNGSFSDAKKLRMNTLTFVPQISESAPAGTLHLSRQGSPGWREPVVAFAGKPVPSDADDSVELQVDLRDYTEACVVHEFNGRMEINPWFSIIPLRNNQGGWSEGNTPVSNSDRSDHATVYVAGSSTQMVNLRKYSPPGDPDDEDDPTYEGLKSIIAAMGPDIVFIQPRRAPLNSFDAGRIDTPGHQKMSFRGIIVSQWIPDPSSNENPPERIRQYYRVAERGENGKGLDDLRYILVR